MPSETYQAVKLEQVKSETITRIYGRSLDDGGQLDLTNRTRDDSRFAVQWCLCVQDSPESPCHCLPLIVWLWRPDVIAYGKTDQKDHAGETLYFFDLENDATLLLDRVQPISTSAAKRLAGLSPGDVEKLLVASTTLAGIPFGGPTTISQEFDPSTWATFWSWLFNDSGLFDAIDMQQMVRDYIRQHHGS
jgi:hypothetical protein